jgi:hypothetical protein
MWYVSRRAETDVTKVPFDSTLLPSTLPPHFLAYDAPKYIIVHVLALFHSHVRYDLSETRFLVLRPWTSSPVLRILNVVPEAIPTVRSHPANSSADLLPLLPKFLYSAEGQLVAIMDQKSQQHARFQQGILCRHPLSLCPERVIGPSSMMVDSDDGSQRHGRSYSGISESILASY